MGESSSRKVEGGRKGEGAYRPVSPVRKVRETDKD